MGIIPVFKTVDTCAAEFESDTPYHYSTYEYENEAIRTDNKKVVILGSGPNRLDKELSSTIVVFKEFLLPEMLIMKL